MTAALPPSMILSVEVISFPHYRLTSQWRLFPSLTTPVPYLPVWSSQWRLFPSLTTSLPPSMILSVEVISFPHYLLTSQFDPLSGGYSPPLTTSLPPSMILPVDVTSSPHYLLTSQWRLLPTLTTSLPPSMILPVEVTLLPSLPPYLPVWSSQWRLLSSPHYLLTSQYDPPSGGYFLPSLPPYLPVEVTSFPHYLLTSQWRLLPSLTTSLPPSGGYFLPSPPPYLPVEVTSFPHYLLTSQWRLLPPLTTSLPPSMILCGGYFFPSLPPYLPVWSSQWRLLPSLTTSLPPSMILSVEVTSFPSLPPYLPVWSSQWRLLPTLTTSLPPSMILSVEVTSFPHYLLTSQWRLLPTLTTSQWRLLPPLTTSLPPSMILSVEVTSYPHYLLTSQYDPPSGGYFLPSLPPYLPVWSSQWRLSPPLTTSLPPSMILPVEVISYPHYLPTSQYDPLQWRLLPPLTTSLPPSTILSVEVISFPSLPPYLPVWSSQWRLSPPLTTSLPPSMILSVEVTSYPHHLLTSQYDPLSGGYLLPSLPPYLPVWSSQWRLLPTLTTSLPPSMILSVEVFSYPHHLLTSQYDPLSGGYLLPSLPPYLPVWSSQWRLSPTLTTSLPPSMILSVEVISYPHYLLTSQYDPLSGGYFLPSPPPYLPVWSSQWRLLPPLTTSLPPSMILSVEVIYSPHHLLTSQYDPPSGGYFLPSLPPYLQVWSSQWRLLPPLTTSLPPSMILPVEVTSSPHYLLTSQYDPPSGGYFLPSLPPYLPVEVTSSPHHLLTSQYDPLSGGYLLPSLPPYLPVWSSQWRLLPPLTTSLPPSMILPVEVISSPHYLLTSQYDPPSGGYFLPSPPPYLPVWSSQWRLSPPLTTSLPPSMILPVEVTSSPHHLLTSQYDPLSGGYFLPSPPPYLPVWSSQWRLLPTLTTFLPPSGGYFLPSPPPYLPVEVTSYPHYLLTSQYDALQGVELSRLGAVGVGHVHHVSPPRSRLDGVGRLGDLLESTHVLPHLTCTGQHYCYEYSLYYIIYYFIMLCHACNKYQFCTSSPVYINIIHYILYWLYYIIYYIMLCHACNKYQICMSSPAHINIIIINITLVILYYILFYYVMSCMQ